MSVRSGQSVTTTFVTSRFDTGAATNADSTPSGTLYVNGTADAASVTVTNITTGLYKAAVTLPTLAVNDVVNIVISATVNSVAGKGKVWEDTKDVFAGAIPDVAAGGSGGLFIAGSNAATTISGLTTGALSCTTITASGAVAFQSTFAVTTSTSLAALSCTTLTASGAVAFQSTFATTGLVSMAAGLTITQSSSNASALVVTGNGTGHGAVITSGGGIGADGMRVVSVATNGSGLVALANGASAGIVMQGITGPGLSVQTGGTTATQLGTATITSLTMSGALTVSGAVTATNASNNITGIDVAKINAISTGSVTTISAFIGSTGAAVNGTNVNTLASHDPGATIGTSTLTQTQVTGGAYALNSSSFAFNASLDFTTAQKAATLARVTLVDTITTYTGNTPQTGDSFALIGATGSGLTSLAPSSTALSTATWTGTLATNLGTLASHDPGTTIGTSTLTQAQVLTTALTESYAADGVAPTLAQFQFMMWSLLAERAIASTTLTSKKLDGSTTAMTFTLDSATTPTSQTRAT